MLPTEPLPLRSRQLLLILVREMSMFWHGVAQYSSRISALDELARSGHRDRRRARVKRSVYMNRTAPVPENSERRVVQRGPGEAEISRTPLKTLDEFITPTHFHYVRDHLTDVPRSDLSDWSLRIEGLVESPTTLSLDDLKRLPTVENTVTMECAGNGGANGAIGAGCISTARWRGPRLRDLLGAAGLLAKVREVVVTGGDRGSDPDDPKGPGHYARSLPIEKALDPDTIVALYMNGEPLPIDHGFPARLVVPGWYGMDSIKWIESIRAQHEPFEGFYVQHRYREHRGPDGLDTGRRIQNMLVKSLIAHPRLGETLPVGIPYRVEGVAWAGDAGISGVSVSVDGGASWLPAQLTGPEIRHAWRLWQYSWTPGQVGPAMIMARATDTEGRTQPIEPVSGQIYEANWVHRVQIEVRS